MKKYRLGIVRPIEINFARACVVVATTVAAALAVITAFVNEDQYWWSVRICYFLSNNMTIIGFSRPSFIGYSSLPTIKIAIRWFLWK